MKKFIVAGVMAFSMFSATAQQKIAHINTEELIASMPEAVKAEKELKEYQESLGDTYDELTKELNTKDSIFVKDSLKFTPSMKTIKRDELISLYQKVSNWQQQAQEMYQQEANKKIGPIREKALEAIKVVAKENNYGYVLDAQNLIVSAPADDILVLVKKKLGIKEAVKPAGK